MLGENGIEEDMKMTVNQGLQGNNSTQLLILNHKWNLVEFIDV